MYGEPIGPQAARLRQRKFNLARRFHIPDDLLPGSLSLSHLRCGKPNCHCARPKDPGHPTWHLTFMADGKKHVQHIPREWVEEVRKRVAAGHEYQDAVREVLGTNARLLVLARQQKKRSSGFLVGGPQPSHAWSGLQPSSPEQRGLELP